MTWGRERIDNLLELASHRVNPWRRNSQVPDDPKERERLEYVVRYINFPPVESLSLRPWIVMVVVVPAFAKGNESEEPVIATVIC
jgi:hypothetical protein